MTDGSQVECPQCRGKGTVPPDRLTEAEWRAYRLRYGDSPLTYRRIAEQMGMSLDRARMLIAKADRKLRFAARVVA